MPWIAKYRILAKPALTGMSSNDINGSSYSSFNVVGSSSCAVRANMSRKELEMHYEEEQMQYKKEIERLQMIVLNQRMLYPEETNLNDDDDNCNEDTERASSKFLEEEYIGDNNGSAEHGETVLFENDSDEGDIEFG
eukprot:CAMPEP_0172497388 /NCGR_PEP_ID=MMETSP1066-20121228/99289_1 /TAXON_ID=671091 /ORGANISM="Coscinodiscus wailesii, Strain CCMP2513" /LENGTH=136 /DNA_ID=CAMNT_0013270133 /DNA_START=176 /DNA_END=583 /DNA_ORIENTATION=-